MIHNAVQIKTVETVLAGLSKVKAALYEDQTNTIGFKTSLLFTILPVSTYSSVIKKQRCFGHLKVLIYVDDNKYFLECLCFICQMEFGAIVF